LQLQTTIYLKRNPFNLNCTVNYHISFVFKKHNASGVSLVFEKYNFIEAIIYPAFSS